MDIEPNIMEALIRKGIQVELHGSLEDTIVKEFLAEVEPRIREKVKVAVDQIAVGSVKRFQDMAQMTDQIGILMHWKEEDK